MFISLCTKKCIEPEEKLWPKKLKNRPNCWLTGPLNTRCVVYFMCQVSHGNTGEGDLVADLNSKVLIEENPEVQNTKRNSELRNHFH